MRYLPYALIYLLFATVASARPIYTIKQSVLRYSQLHKSATTSTDETLIETMPNSLEICANIDRFNLYLYPTTAGSVGLGYLLMKQFELSAIIGFNSDSTAGSTSTSTNNFTVAISYTKPIDKNSIEIYAPISLYTASSGTSGNISTSSTTELGVEVYYVLPIVKGFSWAAGPAYYMGSGSDKVASGASTSTSNTKLMLNLTQVRLRF